jgi:hypothetical protein
VSVLFALSLTQTVLVRRGSSLLPGFGGDRPLQPDPVPRRRRGTGSVSTRHERERERSTADSAADDS